MIVGTDMTPEQRENALQRHYRRTEKQQRIDRRLQRLVQLSVPTYFAIQYGAAMYDGLEH